MCVKHKYMYVAAKTLQSCPTLCDHIDGSPPGSPVPGILQARTLECSSPVHESEKWKWSRSSHVRPSATPWTAADQAPPSMGFSRQECCSELPFPSSRDFPDPEIKPASLTSLALAGRFFTTELSGKPDWHAHWLSCSNWLVLCIKWK